MVQDMKESFKTSKKQLPFSLIEMYPELPSELPASILVYAYVGDDQPVTKYLDRLSNAALKHIPLRKNHGHGLQASGADEHAMDEPMDVGSKPDMVQVN